MLKWWADEQDIKIKSLVMEVLALQFLPVDVPQQAPAIKQFFVRASYFISEGNRVEDPARLCGPIQADLDYAVFGDLLGEAASDAARAMNAFTSDDYASAVRYWGAVFGASFPEAPVASPAPVAAPPRPVKDTPQG